MRRRSRQLELPLPARRGGARPGAGRPRLHPALHGGKDLPHRPRPELSRRHPVHITLRVAPDVPHLRGAPCVQALELTLRRSAPRSDFRVCHFSVQHDHVHLIVEADGKEALSRGMQGLCIWAARRINAVLGRRGRVLADRYHARALSTPREVKHCLRYVLLNARKHWRARGNAPEASWVDPCSSAWWFDGWSRPVQTARWRMREQAPPPVRPARTWLLRTGWWLRWGRLDPSRPPGPAP